MISTNSLAAALPSILAQTNSSGGPLVFLIPLVFGVIGLAGLVLWIWALIDAIKNPKLEGNMRLIWVLVIVFVGPIGAIVYLAAGR